MAFGSRDLSFASLHTSKLFFVMDDSTPLCRARAVSTLHAAATCPKRTATTTTASANVAWQRRRRGASTRAVDRRQGDSRKIVKMPSQHARSLRGSMARSWGTFLVLAVRGPRVYAHTMYFAVFLLHTMYFGDFGGRWLRPRGTCKALIPGDVDEIASATGISATGETAGAVQRAP